MYSSELPEMTLNMLTLHILNYCFLSVLKFAYTFSFHLLFNIYWLLIRQKDYTGTQGQIADNV